MKMHRLCQQTPYDNKPLILLILLMYWFEMWWRKGNDLCMDYHTAK